MQTPSLHDVARAAGVGVATASRALNGRYGVKAGTRERVERAAAELGYHVNPVLASLAARRFEGPEGVSVALLTRHRRAGSSPYGRCEEAAQARGWTLEHIETSDWADAARLSRVLRSRGFAAVWLHHITHSPEWFADFDWTSFVAVCTDIGFSEVRLPLVRHSETSAMWKGLEALHTRGYRRIGVVLPDWKLRRIENLRQYGMTLAFQQLEIPSKDRIPPLALAPLGEEAAGWAEALRDWLAAQKPEVLFVHNMFRGLVGALPKLERPPYAVFQCRGSEAGIVSLANPEEETIALIGRLLRARAFGLLDAPTEVLIPVRWRDGPELGKGE